MYVVAVLAAFITSLSPLGGMIFTLAYGGKYRENITRFLTVFLATGILLFITKIVDVVTFTDIFLGVGIAAAIYFFVLRKTGNYLFSILAAYGFDAIIAIIKKIAFGSIILDNINIALNTYQKLMESSFQNNPEQMDLGLQLMETTRQIFEQYYVGIWMLSIIVGLYLGTLIISKNSEIKWQHRFIQLQYESIYFVIAALILFVIPKWRILGMNALLILAPLFLIEGISILDFYWGDFFKKTKFLLFLLIISMVFNYFILSLIALIGLLDIWFDFRKIRNTEDIDETNSS
ncbi:MAG: YybS family protein [Candidatus Cloacimonetes bacterium]|nr:YybS family protein [Candidatus Cloacimonadota bacterium]MCF7813254.1 YybS family protein [Candidatus Cloacimonadota bacterium]MCF7867453.1 YybS family protein [Candidatus Cloacimonadota bacterium]MCF7882915.1 YybS family protein [Candidatus Cloacimonadota bacterium]